jgi:hypothetical protein
MRTRNRLVVFAAVGITFVLHSALQWYSWALADSINHRYPLPFTFLSFPVIWLTGQFRAIDGVEQRDLGRNCRASLNASAGSQACSTSSFGRVADFREL